MTSRTAPRRSTRPVRALNQASTALKKKIEEVVTAPIALRPGRRCGAADHGPRLRNQTSRPRYAAASSLIDTSGRSGKTPVHAARSSLATGGVHDGGAGWNR